MSEKGHDEHVEHVEHVELGGRMTMPKIHITNGTMP